MVVLLLLVLSFDVFVPTSAHPLSFLSKQFVQIYFNISSLDLDLFEFLLEPPHIFKIEGHFAYCPIVHNQVHFFEIYNL